MKHNLIYSILFFGLIFASCDPSNSDARIDLDIPSPVRQDYGNKDLDISAEKYSDKILGALVGSAIGDAMGASTEMWHRNDIQKKYGYINGLTAAVREQSPEGTWAHHLNAGATTDDTRWKFLMVKYLAKHGNDLNAKHFASFIADYYQSLVSNLSNENNLSSPDALDNQMEKVDWIKEWARVAVAYPKSKGEFSLAQNRFYGGEMSCAGMLFTPMFGLITSNPNAAYELAFDHTIFDLGYAKDISSIVSAMCNMAMQTDDLDSILNTILFVDPHGYQDSRLISRIPYSIAKQFDLVVIETKDSSLFEKAMDASNIPYGFPGSNYEWAQQNYVYEAMEKEQKAIAFHSAEIWTILFTALKFGEGDFEKTMQFIVNYGRDNDTVAAVAGMILGAKIGYSKLPKQWRDQVVLVNKESMGIDLKALAKELAKNR